MNSAQDTLAGGLPHSEIPGSPIARISPGLFAACHVLHRLSVPRHPPDALASRLIIASPHRRCRTTAAHRAKPHALPRNKRRAAASMKTLLSDKPERQAWLCLHPALSASVTSQLSLHPSISRAAVARGGVAQSSPNVVRRPRNAGSRKPVARGATGLRAWWR